MAQQRTSPFDDSSIEYLTRERSALDRTVDLSDVSWHSLGWIAAFVLAASIRLISRTAWPLSVSEARLASDALAFVRGESISPDAAARPLATGLTAVAMFLFGDSDGIVRLVPLLAGLGVIALLYGLRDALGSGTALGAALVVAVSPTLVYISRSAGEGVLIAYMTLLLLWSITRQERNDWWGSALAGIASAGLVLAGPLGWLALPLTLIAASVIAPPVAWAAQRVGLMAVAAIGTVLAVATGFFTRPEGLAAFVGENLGALWRDHLSRFGDDWHLSVFQLVIDEPLSLVLGVVAGIYALWPRDDDTLGTPVRGLILWAVAAVVVSILIGGKGPEVYALAALPLALVAGAGLSSLAGHSNWREIRTARGLVYLIVVSLTFLAALSTIGLLLGDTSDLLVWGITFLLVGIFILAPLISLTIWLGRQFEGPHVPAVALLAIVLLFGLAIRTSVLLAYTNTDRNGSLLTVGDTSPAVTFMTGRLERLSRDLTTYQQSVQDLTGGHGLIIAVDETLEQPFRWYLREFPNLTVITGEAVAADPQRFEAIIARPGHPILTPNETERTERIYAYRLMTADALANPSGQQLAREALNPRRWRSFADFLLYRRTVAPPPPEAFTLSVQRELGTRLFGQNLPRVP